MALRRCGGEWKNLKRRRRVEVVKARHAAIQKISWKAQPSNIGHLAFTQAGNLPHYLEEEVEACAESARLVHFNYSGLTQPHSPAQLLNPNRVTLLFQVSGCPIQSFLTMLELHDRRPRCKFHNSSAIDWSCPVIQRPLTHYHTCSYVWFTKDHNLNRIGGTTSQTRS